MKLYPALKTTRYNCAYKYNTDHDFCKDIPNQSVGIMGFSNEHKTAGGFGTRGGSQQGSYHRLIANCFLSLTAYPDIMSMWTNDYILWF